ncbi:MAG: aldo/keto reductase [Candidatus Hydrogenedentes bacterium]|nr:aldo/keto reductase [Candidatus Hydrogenedentota bacterium]
MKKRALGASGIEVSPLAFGGNIFGWTVDEAMSFTLLDAFAGAGFNFIDTADMYSNWAPGNKGGESETIIGKWLKRSGKRKDAVIATKIGTDLGQSRKGLSRARILRGVEDSLARLQTDYIDLYQSHIDDAETPLEETLAAYAQLIEQGKVRAIGASNYSADRLAQALKTSQQHGYPRYQSLQPEYNLCERAGYESALEPLCRKENVAVIPYFPLAAGFLTGKYRSEADLTKSARGQMVKKYLNDRGLRILDALDAVAKEHHSTPAGVALAWLLARPGITAPIASATSLGQLKDLLGAVELNLTADAVKRLDQASS